MYHLLIASCHLVREHAEVPRGCTQCGQQLARRAWLGFRVRVGVRVRVRVGGRARVGVSLPVVDPPLPQLCVRVRVRVRVGVRVGVRVRVRVRVSLPVVDEPLPHLRTARHVGSEAFHLEARPG